MTLKFVDVVQGIIVKEEDCHTTKGLLVEAIIAHKQYFKIENLVEQIANCYAFADIIHRNNKTILFVKIKLLLWKWLIKLNY